MTRYTIETLKLTGHNCYTKALHLLRKRYEILNTTHNISFQKNTSFSK